MSQTAKMQASRELASAAASLHACRRVAAAPTVRDVLDALTHEIQQWLAAAAVGVRFDRHALDASTPHHDLDPAPIRAPAPATEMGFVGDRIYEKSWAQFAATDSLIELRQQNSADVVRLLEWHGAIIGAVRIWTERPLSDEHEEGLDDLLTHGAIALWRSHRYEQLRDGKREWEEVFDGMLDGVCLCRKDGVVLRANCALAALTGRPVVQLIGIAHDHLFTDAANNNATYNALPDDGLPHVAPALNEFASSQIREFRVPATTGRNDGENAAHNDSDRIFVESIFPLRAASSHAEVHDDGDGKSIAALSATDSGAHHVCIIREITSQRRLQEQLVQSEKLAALGELVSGVAHELNNPLTTVVGYAQLLETDAQLPSQLAQSVRLIGQEAQRAAQIVGNLLAFARGSQPEKMALAPAEVLLSTLKLRSYLLRAENIRVQTHIAPALPQVWGDPLQLQQVFLNIINNAAQAMSDWRGGGELQVEMALVPGAQSRLENGATALRVTFSDNGPGIAPDHLRRVFDPFFTTKGIGRGTGLGMSISHGIIANHNGAIWAESRPGQGAQFFLDLPPMNPQNLEDQLSAMDKSTPIPPRLPATDARKILVVDDEEPVVMLITEILGLDGHQVTPAFNGAEALALLHTQPFDLIISDVRMPAVGGPTFFEILQTTRPDVLPRVLFVTGDTVSPSTQSFLQHAARPMLTKPFSPDRLRQMVAQCLARTVD